LVSDIYLDGSLILKGSILRLSALFCGIPEGEVEDHLCHHGEDDHHAHYPVLHAIPHEDKIKNAAFHYGNYNFGYPIVKKD